MAERLRFERELASLELGDHDKGPTTQEVAIGQRIVVNLKNTEYAAYDIVKIHWTIPGKCVGNYEATRKKATLTELAAADFEQPSVTFYWIEPGASREVRVSITYKAGGTEKKANVLVGVFDVKAPRLDHFKAATKRVVLLNVRQRRGPMLHGIAFGDETRKVHGIAWDWKVTIPVKHEGWIKDLQTVRENRVKTPTTGKQQGRRNPAKLALHEQLDQSLLDDGTEPTYSAKDHYPPIAFPTLVAGGKSVRDNVTFDSPHTSLDATDKAVTVDDSFKYFILYKPKQDGAIWVPVAKAEWCWKATAELGSTGWKLKAASGQVTSTGRVTTEFPRYESNVSYNTWVDI